MTAEDGRPKGRTAVAIGENGRTSLNCGIFPQSPGLTKGMGYMV